MEGFLARAVIAAICVWALTLAIPAFLTAIGLGVPGAIMTLVWLLVAFSAIFYVIRGSWPTLR